MNVRRLLRPLTQIMRLIRPVVPVHTLLCYLRRKRIPIKLTLWIPNAKLYLRRGRKVLPAIPTMQLKPK